jgi:hypothetical protein
MIFRISTPNCMAPPFLGYFCNSSTLVYSSPSLSHLFEAYLSAVPVGLTRSCICFHRQLGPILDLPRPREKLATWRLPHHQSSLLIAREESNEVNHLLNSLNHPNLYEEFSELLPCTRVKTRIELVRTRLSSVDNYPVDSYSVYIRARVRAKHATLLPL